MLQAQGVRVKKSQDVPRFYSFSGFRLDTVNRELLRDGQPVQLTQKCFDTLVYLVRNHGRMLKKEEILGFVWREHFVEEANLAQHIYMIRKALKHSGESSKLIETIPKYGYRFVGRVEEIRGAEDPEESSANETVEPEAASTEANPVAWYLQPAVKMILFALGLIVVFMAVLVLLNLAN